MNAIIRSKAFRYGDAIAVCLPEIPGISEGVEFEVAVDGPEITIRPVLPPTSPEEGKRRLHQLLADLQAIGPVPRDASLDADERIEFPERYGH